MTEEGNGLPELPKGWVWTILDEIAQIILGQSPPSSTYNEDGVGPPFYQGKAEFGDVYPTPRKWCSQPKKIAEKGDVLISVRAPVGPTNICPEKSCIGRGLAAIRGLDEIQPRFVLYLMRSSENVIAGRGTGTTFNAITGSQLRDFEIPFPPLPEQHRIVAKIEELFTQLDAGVAALETARAQLRRYRQAVLKAAVEGELTREWREAHRGELEPASVLLERILEERRAKWETKHPGKQYKPPVPPDTDDLPGLPEGWVWTNLRQLKEFSLYGPRFSSKDYSREGKVVLRTSDISDSGKVSLDKAPRLPLDDEQFVKYRCEVGDLLITRTGSLGTLAVFNDDVEAIPGAYLIQYRLAAPIDTTWYLFYLFKSLRGQKHLVSGGAGVGRPNLNAPTIEEFTIPLPPVAEQQRIIAEVEQCLSVADELEKAVEQSLKRAERLRQSILKRAFEGKLVPQDPSDEPASVLLERIKAEKARREGERKGRKKGTRKKRRKTRKAQQLKML